MIKKVQPTGVIGRQGSRTAGVCLLLALAGCSDQDITTYRVPKDPGAATAAVPAAPGAPDAAASLRWATPAGWQPQAAGGLRTASFLAPGPGGGSADVSVVRFAGAGGDVLANINRWRSQLHLAPISAEDLPAAVTALDAAAGHFLLADIRGTADPGQPASRILGAWLEQPGQVWFFKMMGPGAAVEAQQDAFRGFLRSVAPGAAGNIPPVQAEAKPSENTNDLPKAGFVVARTSAADGPALHWQVPPGWQLQPVTAMRQGSYTVSRGGVAGDLSITAFPGDVGGLAANVNRWRGQVGLPPLDGAALDATLETFDANGLHFTLVDVAGPAPAGRQRILAALASWQGATWFFKLMGPDGLVEDEKAAFGAFLRTVGPK